MLVKEGAKYLGPLNREDIEPKALVIMDKQLSGNEKVLEHRGFEIEGFPAIVQRRLA